MDGPGPHKWDSDPVSSLQVGLESLSTRVSAVDTELIPLCPLSPGHLSCRTAVLRPCHCAHPQSHECPQLGQSQVLCLLLSAVIWPVWVKGPATTPDTGQALPVVKLPGRMQTRLDALREDGEIAHRSSSVDGV